jgi:hypothetical protein
MQCFYNNDYTWLKKMTEYIRVFQVYPKYKRKYKNIKKSK